MLYYLLTNFECSETNIAVEPMIDKMFTKYDKYVMQLNIQIKPFLHLMGRKLTKLIITLATLRLIIIYFP